MFPGFFGISFMMMFMIRWKDAVALHRPNGILVYLVAKTVFGLSLYFITICQKVEPKSRVMKNLAPVKEVIVSSILGKGYASFTVTAYCSGFERLCTF